MRGISGSLLSLEVLDTLEQPAPGSSGRVRRAIETAYRHLGPTSAARAVFDSLVVPLFDAAGVRLTVVSADSTLVTGAIESGESYVSAVGWNQDMGHARDRAFSRLPGRPAWWIGTNGAELRLVNTAHAFSRRFVGIALEDAIDDERTADALVALLCRGASHAALDGLVERSHAMRSAVAESLQHGVHDALIELVAALTVRTRKNTPPDETLGQALTVIYRVLFLLFAEARGLVPRWHPVYGNAYTIESLRPAIERGSPVSGMWSTLQAISRLAHRGCRAGALRVTPFNGRLFSPSGAPALDQARLDDRRIRQVLLALTTRPDTDRRARISYADLGVEQLGAVYERVLEVTPRVSGGSITLAPTARRKNSGTFYTPRTLTEFMVRRTLAPLVRDRTADEILAVRILDPAMGSGAFLVASCRYLADAYERALVADGSCTHDAITPTRRAGFRRLIAQRCLYGVDVNPVAVQLSRLSLWLCTLAAGKPLTFFDHHLRCGNSIVGASIDDVLRQRPGHTGSRATALPLFASSEVAANVAACVAVRAPLALQPDDSPGIVRAKERAVAGLDGPGGPLAALRRLCDAWCAVWFWPPELKPIDARAWGAFAAAITGGQHGLPTRVAESWLRTAAATAEDQRFFHWALEFPEIFHDADGQPLDTPGFDAVIGNPPWETLRGDFGTETERRDSHQGARRVTNFVRDSGCYAWQGFGHANLYQVFAERMLRLTRNGGRTGLLVPGTLLTDRGSGRLREILLDECRIDALVAFDNRDRIFPIHRGVRFSVLTATPGGRTDHLVARFGLHATAGLDDVPDEGLVRGSVSIPRSLIARFGGDAPVIPELASDLDRSLLAGILARAPALGTALGWNARFGRELNATDDAGHFGRKGMPVLEGKHLEPFGVTIPADVKRIERRAAERRLSSCPFDSPRLGYREVASATNRLTLIAAMIPAGCVTTHTVFCARPGLASNTHWFLCGVFNSFVANFLVRLRGSTHVPASTIHQLPVPKRSVDDPLVLRIAALAHALSDRNEERDAIELQCAVAVLYELSSAELDRVLSTFTLVHRPLRDAVSTEFRARSMGYSGRIDA